MLLLMNLRVTLEGYDVAVLEPGSALHFIYNLSRLLSSKSFIKLENWDSGVFLSIIIIFLNIQAI